MLILVLSCCLLGAVAQAQQRGLGIGPVWRVSLIKVKPGKIVEAMAEIRQNFKPIFEEAKKQGVVVDFKVFTNVGKDSGADWDIMTAVAFKNWTALDEVGSKMGAIVQKHYGSREKQLAAAEHRRELSELISERFVREPSLDAPSTPQAAQAKEPQKQ
jgi:hypothetical protein